MNRIFISGYVGTDPITRYTSNGNKVFHFSLSSMKRRKLEGSGYLYNFFDVDLWGKSAEYGAENIRKGDFLYLEGRLDNDVFEQNGQKQTRTKIIADRIEFPPRQKEELEDETEELLSVPSSAEEGALEEVERMEENTAPPQEEKEETSDPQKQEEKKEPVGPYMDETGRMKLGGQYLDEIPF